MHVEHPEQVLLCWQQPAPAKSTALAEDPAGSAQSCCPLNTGAGEQSKKESHFPDLSIKTSEVITTAVPLIFLSLCSFFPSLLLSVSQPLWLPVSKELNYSSGTQCRVQEQHVCSLDPFPCCHCNEEADEKVLLYQNTTSINLMEEERLPGHASCQRCCLGRRFVSHSPAASLFLLKYFAAMPTSPF